MAIEIQDWTKQIEDLDVLGLDRLHETYSEMLATAHDIKFQVPDELLVQTDDDAELRRVIAELHPMIVEHAAVSSRESAGEPDDNESSTSPEKAPPKKERKKTTTIAKKKAAARSEGAETAEETTAPAPTPSPKNPAKTAAKKGTSERKSDQMSAAKKTKATKKTATKKTTKTAGKATKKSAKTAASNARTPVRAGKFAPDATIHVKLKENPARAGTGRFDRVANLMKHDGKTVEQFLKSGGARGTLNFSVAQGWITVK